MIIGISGKIGSGKTTLGNILYEKLGYKLVAFADILKGICAIILNINPNELNTLEGKNKYYDSFNLTGRQLLQKIGTDIFQNEFGENIWIKLLFNKYKKESLIIHDVRFIHEADYILKYGGILIRINKDGNNNNNHISETGLDDYNKFTYIIDNNGTIEDLKKYIDTIL